MKKQRRKHTAEFKAKVALEALKGMETEFLEKKSVQLGIRVRGRNS